MTKAIAAKLEKLADKRQAGINKNIKSDDWLYCGSWRHNYLLGASAHSDLVKAELEGVRDTMRIILGNYALMDMYDLVVREALEKLEGLIDE